MIMAIVVVLVVLLVIGLTGSGPRSGCCGSTSAGWCSGSGG